MKLICKNCHKEFTVNIYQELCPSCSHKEAKAKAKLHSMVFKGKPMTEKAEDRLLALRELLDYHRQEYPRMYQGNDEAWCKEQQDALAVAFNNPHTTLNRKAQRDLTASLYQKKIDSLIEEIEKHSATEKMSYRDGG